MTATKKAAGIAAAAGFIGCVVLANYLTARFRFVPVGFSQNAVAGTFAAGLALGLRDFIQDGLGRWGVVAAIAGGAALSFTVSPAALAMASALAFGVSELADFAIYTPLRTRARFGDRRWLAAVTASNLAGAVVDTVLFLAVAYGAAAILPGLPGQLIGKGYATTAVLIAGAVIGAVIRRDRVPHPSVHRPGTRSNPVR